MPSSLSNITKFRHGAKILPLQRGQAVQANAEEVGVEVREAREARIAVDGSPPANPAMRTCREGPG